MYTVHIVSTCPKEGSDYHYVRGTATGEGEHSYNYLSSLDHCCPVHVQMDGWLPGRLPA